MGGNNEVKIWEDLNSFECHVSSRYSSAAKLCEFCWGDPFKPGHNFSNLKSISKKYIVCLFPAKKVFIVWNYEMHKTYKNRGAAQTSFTVSNSWEELLTSKPAVTYPYYKRLGTKKDAPYEKIYVVHVDETDEFFSDFEKYMHFNEYDTDERGHPLEKRIVEQEKSPLSDDERRCYSSLKRQRRAEFRNEVLESYRNRCAICRCSVIQLLQAAHLHGYEVARTDLSADKAEHGICLCANHHLMYDNHLIDINIREGTIRIFEDGIKDMPWYREFQKCGNKLLERQKET